MSTIRIRRDLASNWTKWDPVLADGEPGFERDTKRLKIGDGTTRWSDLPYFTPDLPDNESISDQELTNHINSLTPHPVYDDGPSLFLLYENAKV